MNATEEKQFEVWLKDSDRERPLFTSSVEACKMFTKEMRGTVRYASVAFEIRAVEAGSEGKDVSARPEKVTPGPEETFVVWRKSPDSSLALYQGPMVGCDAFIAGHTFGNDGKRVDFEIRPPATGSLYEIHEGKGDG